MNFRDYWTALCKRNKPLYDEEAKMTIPVKSFKSQLEKAYAAGAKDQAAVAKELEALGKKDSPLDNLFKGLF